MKVTLKAIFVATEHTWLESLPLFILHTFDYHVFWLKAVRKA